MKIKLSTSGTLIFSGIAIAGLSSVWLVSLNTKSVILALTALSVTLFAYRNSDNAYLLPIYATVLQLNFFFTPNLYVTFSAIAVAFASPFILIQNREAPPRRWLVLIILLVLETLPSLQNVGDLRVEISLFQWYGMTIYCVNVYYHVRKNELIRKLLRHWCIAGTIVAFGGWAQFLNKPFPWTGASYAPGLPDSSLGYYSNFGSFCACLTIVSVGFFMNTNGLRKLLWILPLAALFSGTAITLSRGAALLLLSGLLTFIAVQRKLARAFPILLASGTIAIVVIWFFIPVATTVGLLDRFLSFQNGDIVRNQLQQAGLSLALSHPFGLGLWNFQKTVASSGLLADQALAHSHNTYIQIALDFGWLGIGLLVIGLFRIFRGAFIHRTGFILSAAIATLAGICVQGTQDFMFYETANLLLAGTLSIAGFQVLSSGTQVSGLDFSHES